jgi:hypothetical protein
MNNESIVGVKHFEDVVPLLHDYRGFRRACRVPEECPVTSWPPAMPLPHHGRESSKETVTRDIAEFPLRVRGICENAT